MYPFIPNELGYSMEFHALELIVLTVIGAVDHPLVSYVSLFVTPVLYNSWFVSLT